MPRGDRNPSIEAFVQAQYKWSKHENLCQVAVIDILSRLKRANARVDKLLPQKDRKGDRVPTNDDLRKLGVFELIDDVISTRMGYAQVAKKRQGRFVVGKSSKFPYDWDEVIDGRKLITTELEASIANDEAASCPLAALRVAAGDQITCEPVSVTAMSKFERVAEVDRDLVLNTPPAIYFTGNILFTDKDPFSFDKSGNHPRVAHGEYTYNVTFKDGGAVSGLPASMLALVENTDTETAEGIWSDERLDGVIAGIISYVELAVRKARDSDVDDVPPAVHALQKKLKSGVTMTSHLLRFVMFCKILSRNRKFLKMFVGSLLR
jgi:hypothetical protein